MPAEKTWRLPAGVLGAALLCWLVLRYLLPAAWPVLAGAALGVWMRQLGRRLSCHTALGEKGCALAVGGFFCVLVPLLLYRGAVVLAVQAGALVEQAAGLWRWDVLPDWLTEKIPATLREQAGDWVRSAVEKGAGWLAGAAGGVLQALPGTALSVFIGTVTLFWWAADRDGIVRSLASLLPAGLRSRMDNHPWRQPVTRFLGNGLRAAGAYLRAQAAIGAVVLLVLTVGLTLLSVPSPAAWALLITLVDLLPFLGAAVILVPWAAFAFFAHRTALGIALAVLTAVVWLLRQFLEPRLLGKAMGVHPWIMLAGLFVSYRLAGVRGILVCAVLLGAGWRSIGQGDPASAADG